MSFRRAAHPEADVTILGAARDCGPIVRLGYGSLRRTTSGHSDVLVADNGCDADAVAFLSAQPWLELIPLADRLACAQRQYQQSATALASTWSKLAGLEATLTGAEHRVLAELKRRVRPEPPMNPEDFAQLGETVDWLLPKVTTRYAVLVDSDVEFRHHGWLTDVVNAMDDGQVDLFGFLEPAQPPIQERLVTFVLAMRTTAIRDLDCSFATHLSFGDPAEAECWYSAPHGRYLDTTAFDDYPTARFYDTAARVYEAAGRRGLRCAQFPAAWRTRFNHLGHMAWSARVDDGYAGADGLRDHRRHALDYARRRCAALGIGPLG